MYPTYNLRELVKDVALRLAGRNDKAYRKLSVNYGGGKTHTLITLRHNESNDVHAFKVVVDDAPLLTTIKADKRARIQETAISSEAMLPGGPYDLWREGEPSRRVKDLVGAFAQFPKLPKMLRHREILDTVVQGVQQGIWVARVVRPDRTTKTFWRTAIDETALKDAGLEVLLPEAATLSELAPGAQSCKSQPGKASAKVKEPLTSPSPRVAQSHSQGRCRQHPQVQCPHRIRGRIRPRHDRGGDHQRAAFQGLRRVEAWLRPASLPTGEPAAEQLERRASSHPVIHHIQPSRGFAWPKSACIILIMVVIFI